MQPRVKTLLHCSHVKKPLQYRDDEIEEKMQGNRKFKAVVRYACAMWHYAGSPTALQGHNSRAHSCLSRPKPGELGYAHLSQTYERDAASAQPTHAFKSGVGSENIESDQSATHTALVVAGQP